MGTTCLKEGNAVQQPYGIPVSLNLEDPPLIRVDGEGRIEASPDTAVLSLGAGVRADQAAAAYSDTATLLSRVVGALLEVGIPREQIQTEQIALSPVYERDRLVGYEGFATLRVTLRDLGAVGQVIDRAVAAGANRIQGIHFEVREPRPYEASALALAVQDARAKAAVLARSLGVRLGPVWLAEAEPSPGPVFPAARTVAMEAAMPVLPGTLTLTRQVRLAYLIQYA